MIAIITILISGLIVNGEKQIFDFSSTKTSGKWKIVNDVVMGGISESGLTFNRNGSARFSGTVSPDNNGGFASIRANVEENNLNDFDGVIVKIKGDGNTYNLRFRTDKNYDGIAYQAKFKSEISKWQEFRIPFNDFKATFRGKIVVNQPKLKSGNIRQIGLLIADKQFGKFELDIKYIKFYKNSES